MTDNTIFKDELQEQVNKWVKENDLKFFMDKLTLEAASIRFRQEMRIKCKAKPLKDMIKLARTEHCMFWGNRIKPYSRFRYADGTYWDSLRVFVTRNRSLLADRPINEACTILRRWISTNTYLMNALSEKYRVWK
jgi:hypothetical protein